MTEKLQNFGRLAPKQLAEKGSADVSDNDLYRAEFDRKSSNGERAVAWLSYFTMVYAAIVTMAPQTAVAAVNSISQFLN